MFFYDLHVVDYKKTTKFPEVHVYVRYNNHRYTKVYSRSPRPFYIRDNLLNS